MASSTVLSTANKDPASLIGDLGPYHYLHTILEETPNGVLVVGTDHNVIHANPAASRFMGVDYGDLAGLRLEDVLGLRNGDLFLLIKDKFKKNSGSKTWKIRHEIASTCDDERCVLSVVVVAPVTQLDYYLVYLIDVTQQKKLEEQLRRRNAFFQNLIDSSVDGIIASDMKGNIILFNQEAMALMGYTEEETKNLHVTDLYSEGVAYELIKRMRSDLFGGKGKLLRHEVRVKHRDGSDIPVSFSGGIIYDRDQEIATFGLFTDLRAMQQIEEDLEQTHQALKHSEQLAGLGRLAAGVAHEINNPMSGIMLYANFIAEELAEDHPSRADLETIIHEAERCKVIVGDLLEFSHQTTYEMEPTDLNEVVRKTITILQHQPLFQEVTFAQELSEELHPIAGNYIRLNQVIMNIVVNGAQAMRGKGQLKIISRARANQTVNELVIEDTGPGIEPENLEKIFDPFFTTKTPGEGTGLGLSVSYAIVREHHGSIRVTSEPGKGCSFSLKFPVITES
ncbi:PAS domain S-box protein [Desulforhopalus singaporensis]|uniref:histidine kinase n=1 Tax=Desulforhopalus singaporensis TaxID=91360 RepID=A0A1H0LG19_9BACT|nr:PAS domain S-box protein [Desulforhopalus singaporensis]SDO67168.1 PAS domain S-box-containing protein [Desulforhopalus singaporensis]